MRKTPVVKTFTTKTGKQAIIRYPALADLGEFTEFANALSREDTFVQLSGERISRKEEEKFLRDRLAAIAKSRTVQLALFVDGKLVGNGAIESELRRKKHVGVVHISVLAPYRGIGLGRELLTSLMSEARKKLTLRLLTLTCFANNKPAVHLYEKLGFQCVGEVPGALFWRGGYYNEKIYYLVL